MKKTVLTISIFLTIFLVGCTPSEDDPNSYTEEELTALIEELIPEASVSTTYDMRSFQTAVTDMISVARKGVIYIQTGYDLEMGSGSRVIYKQVDNTYYVVTNAHVMTYDDPFTPEVEEHNLSENTSIAYEENGVLFEIEDEGIGIASDKLESIFKRFSRANSYAGGFGVGLSIVDEISKRYNYSIDIISKEQIGTKISITF